MKVGCDKFVFFFSLFDFLRYPCVFEQQLRGIQKLESSTVSRRQVFQSVRAKQGWNSPREGLGPLLKLTTGVAPGAVVVAGIMIVCDGSPTPLLLAGIDVTGPGPGPGTFETDEAAAEDDDDDGAGSSTTPPMPSSESIVVVVAAEAPGVLLLFDDDDVGVDRTATTSW